MVRPDSRNSGGRARDGKLQLPENSLIDGSDF
jgi:hypothetical protein